MPLFTAVVTGNTTNATDVNQMINVFNGTTSISTGVVIVASAANFTMQTYELSAAPAADQTVVAAQASGDALVRTALYITGTGHGGLLAGNGTTVQAHLLSGTNGWTINESLTMLGALYPVTTTLGSNIAVTGIDFTNGAYLAAYGGSGMDLQIHAGGYLQLYGDGGWVIGHSDRFGWKTHAGARIMELDYTGDLYVAAGTHTNTASFPDTFDYAEVVRCDDDYPQGTVLCIGSNGQFSQCTHDGCTRAVVRSRVPGFLIGCERDGERAIALAGQMRVTTNDTAIQPGDWLTSNGLGGVRLLAQDMEPGRALGYALGTVDHGRVRMLLRYGA